MEAARLIEWVENEARFAELAGAWDRLAGAERFPFLRHAWFWCWWSAFGEGRVLAVCTAWSGGELTAVFPLCRRAGRLESIANVHSPVYRPFARDGVALRAVVEAAVEAAGGSLVVEHLPEGDQAIELLGEVSKAAGRLVRVERQHVSPIVATAGGLEEYRRAVGRKTHKELARLRRRLEDEHDVAFSAIEPPADLGAQLREGFAVEASGWKGRRGTAIAHLPEVEAFYRCVGESFAAAGLLRLSSISVGGRMIAFDLGLVDHGRFWVLKGGYDEAYRRYAPGLLLTLAEVECCFELGLDAFELLGDEAAWKAKFANDARAHLLVDSARLRPGPVVRHAYRRFVRPPLRRAYRRFRGVHG